MFPKNIFNSSLIRKSNMRKANSVPILAGSLIVVVVAAVAGFFTSRALQPPPSGLPTVRAFQAAQGDVARRWLAQRTGWE